MTLRHPARDADPQRDIVSARFFDASRDRVFEALCDPLLLARWWGPKGFANTIHELDVRPGGNWRSVLHAPDGRDFANHSVFVEVVRPERIVFRHISDEHPYEMTISLEEQDGRTWMTWRMRHETAEACARVAPFVVPANEENFDRLAEALARMR
jgi:uncharacterized protein YndB with AHSA1/START domain